MIRVRESCRHSPCGSVANRSSEFDWIVPGDDYKTGYLVRNWTQSPFAALQPLALADPLVFDSSPSRSSPLPA